MSPEIESYGFELTEEVFSEQAVHVISGGKGGVKTRRTQESESGRVATVSPGHPA